MRNLLALLAFVVLLFVGIGWHQGWYKIERSEAPSGKRAYNVEVDTHKITEDVHRGGEKIYETLEKKDDAAKRPEGATAEGTK